MRVNLARAKVRMAQHRLDKLQLGVLQHMGGHGVSERVTGAWGAAISAG